MEVLVGIGIFAVICAASYMLLMYLNNKDDNDDFDGGIGPF